MPPSRTRRRFTRFTRFTRSTSLLPSAALALAAAAPAAAGAGPGRLTLRNATWDAVTVEVRVGRSEDCASNHLIGRHTLPRARGLTVTADGATVCWRREADPARGAGGPSGAWSARRVGAGDAQTVDL